MSSSRKLSWFRVFFFSRSMLPSSLSTTLSLTNKANGLFEWCNQLKVTMTCNDAIIKRRSIFFAKILTVHFFLVSWWVSSAAAALLILTFKYKLKEKDAKKKDICIFDSECSFSINTWINVFEYLSQKRWFCNMLICYYDFTVLKKMQSIGISTNKILAKLSSIVLQNQFPGKNHLTWK